MIDINDITVRIGSKVLLNKASAHISDGQKVGLIGANGCGKSTLFKVFQGELDTETGTICYPNSYQVAAVAQEFHDLDLPVLQYVLNEDKELARLTLCLQTASDMDLADIHERLNAIDAAGAEARAAAILNGLGFTQEDLARPVREFSGGWRMRLALAAVLFRPSDILLLDEPTNHLDLEASIWLESHLRKYRGTLLLISHDKEILNTLCDTIVHIEGKKLNTYSGNYDTFCVTRAMQRQVQAGQIKKQEEHRKHLQAYVDRFRYKASKARQAQSRLKMLARLQDIPQLESETASHFTFPNPPEVSPPLITLDEVSVGYSNVPVLTKLTLKIVENDRIALLGANGNGKSTFAKLLSDRLKPMGGTLHRSPKLEVGYFAQNQAEELPLYQTPTAYMASLMPDTHESKVRSHLARFGLAQEKAITQIDKLSGGEKTRLLFAAITHKAPSLLILDEPTNHLDIEGREALIEAINTYTGSVILITHDLHLIELISDDLWLIKEGSCRVFDGSLDEYKTSLTATKPKSKKKDVTPKPVPETPKITFAEVKVMKGQIARLEKKLATLDGQKKALEALFETPLDTAQLINTQKELTYIVAEMTMAESEWMHLSEQIEASGLK